MPAVIEFHHRTNPDAVPAPPSALDAYLFCERLVEGFAADGPDLIAPIHALTDVLHRHLPLAARISLNRPGRRPGEKIALLPLPLRAAIREIANLAFPPPFVAVVVALAAIGRTL